MFRGVIKNCPFFEFSRITVRLGDRCLLVAIADETTLSANVLKIILSYKRIKRGLYRTKDQKLVNSDINGSANIGRKSKANLFEKSEVLVGLLDAPRRYFIV